MLSQDVVRRLTVIANDTGLTTLKAKLDAVDHAQDRVAVSSSRMGLATEAAERRIQALVRQGGAMAGGGIGSFAGGLVGRVGMDALNFVGRFGPVAIAAATGVKVLNEAIEQGAALMEKYSVAGQRALYGAGGKGIDEQLANLTRFQNDTASPGQIRYAAELSDRLDRAKYTIDQILKVQLDLGDAGLRFQSVWVRVNELTASTLTSISQMPAALAQAGNAPWIKSLNEWMDRRGWTTLPEGAVEMRNGRPVDGSALPQAPGETFEESRARGLNMLRGGLGGGFHGRFIGVLDTPPKDEKASAPGYTPMNEYDRAIKSITKQTEALEIQARTFGMTTEQASRYRIEQELLNAATLAGKTLTDEQRQSVSDMADRYAAATASLERLREQQQLATDINHSFRDAFSGFARDLRNGATFADAMTGALERLSDRLLDMAVNQLWQAAFPTPGRGGLFSSGGGTGLGSLFSAFSGGAGFVAPVLHGGGIAGVDGTPRYVHPAYFENARHYHEGGIAGIPGLMRDEVPAILRVGEPVFRDMAHAREVVGGPAVTINNYNDFSGADPGSEARIRKYVDDSSKRAVAAAVQAVAKLKANDPSYLR